MKNNKSIQFIDRTSGQIKTEIVMGDQMIRFAYLTLAGKILWPILFSGKLLSKIMGTYFNSSLSKKKILPTIKQLNIDVNDFDLPPEQFKSFNHFFSRKLKPGSRPFDDNPHLIASPADGRLLVYQNILDSDPFPVKGAQRSLAQLLQIPPQNQLFSIAIIRLCPADYHRFHFPCNCNLIKPNQRIHGEFHSVNPIALMSHPNLLTTNEREIAFLNSSLFGEFYQIEVGAFGVGAIIQSHSSTTNNFSKMDEKGFFLFGGSTVILAFKSQFFLFNQDLIENTQNGFETFIRAGETIAEFTSK